MKKFLILIIFFYILVLFQTSFLVHFNIKGYTLNLVLIFVVFLNFFEKPENYLGLFSAFIGGFFLDFFSEKFIGFHSLILLTLAISIKFFLKNYVRIPTPKRI